MPRDQIELNQEQAQELEQNRAQAAAARAAGGLGAIARISNQLDQLEITNAALRMALEAALDRAEKAEAELAKGCSH